MPTELSIKKSSIKTIVPISSYTITEELSKLYCIEANIPLSAVTQDVSTWIGCHGSLVDNDTDTKIQGIMTDIEEDYFSTQGGSIKLIIQPNLWITTQDTDATVYQDKTTPELIKELLKPYANDQINLDIKLKENYPKKTMIWRFNEPLYDFISRLMEEEGIYFYFQHNKNTLCIRDANQKSNDTITIKPNDLSFFRKVVTSSSPSTAIHGANLTNPTVLPKGNHATKSHSEIGHLSSYDVSVSSQQLAERKAKLVSERHHCRRQIYQGRIKDIALHPGMKIKIAAPGIPKINNTYRVISSQITDIGTRTTTFSAIPDDIQYRPSLKTPKPTIPGALPGKIVGPEGQPHTALINDQGRYKVKIHLNNNDIYLWLNQLQTYGGSNSGNHFPLLNNTDVYIDFVNGNPDLPYISGAFNTSENPGLISEKNAAISKIQTPSGNIIELDDHNQNIRSKNKVGMMDIGPKDVTIDAKNNIFMKAGNNINATSIDYKNQTYRDYSINCDRYISITGNNALSFFSKGAISKIAGGSVTSFSAATVTDSSLNINKFTGKSFFLSGWDHTATVVTNRLSALINTISKKDTSVSMEKQTVIGICQRLQDIINDHAEIENSSRSASMTSSYNSAVEEQTQIVRRNTSVDQTDNQIIRNNARILVRTLSMYD